MSRTTHKQRPASRLSVEPLEDREAPAILYALTNSQRLQLFDTANPGTLIGAVSLHGMVDPGERITNIDIRPANGWLYGRSDHGRIYAINAATGDVAPVGGQVAFGASAATAFNPLTDQLLFDTASGGSTAINPNDGTVASIGSSTFLGGDVFQNLTPRISALAFANEGPFATQAFGIDPATDTLVTATGTPNLGPYRTVGSLGIDVSNATGFDIDPATGMAFATFQPAAGGSSVLSAVDLNTGAATVLGPVGPSAPLILDVAVVPGVQGASPTLPAAINPTTAGFNATTLGTTIFGPLGLSSGLASGVNPLFVTNLVNGLTSGSITSLNPTVLAGLNTALNSGLIPGINPSLVSAFNTAMTGFNAGTGLGLGTGLTGLGTGLGTGLTGLGTGLTGFGTGLTGVAPTLGSPLTTVLPSLTSGLTTGVNAGLTGSTLGSSLIGAGVNTGLIGSGSLLGSGSTFGTLPGMATGLGSSLVQPLSPGLVGGSIFSPGTQFGFGVPAFSGL
jgi:hypothetical protein